MSAAATRVSARERRDATVPPGQACGQVAGDDFRSANGMTTLMHAACDGRADIAQLLLECGAQVNEKRSDGFTALALAAFFGHREVVELLLESGADVEATTRFGTSAEMWATCRGFLTISELLRQACESKTRSPVSLTIAHHEDLPSTRRREEDDAHKVQLEVTGDEGCEIELETTIIPALTKSKAIKVLPDVIDPPLIAPLAFHPGSVFLSRVTSGGKTLVALGLVVLVVCGFAAFMIFRSLPRGTKEPGKTSAALSGQSNDTPAPSEPNTSEQVGTSDTSPSAPAETATTPGTNAIGTNSSEQDSTEATRKSESVDAPVIAPSANATFRKGNSDSLPNRRVSGVAPTVMRVSAPERKRQPELVNAATKEFRAPDEEAKPAPLSVEAPRNRTTTTPAERPTETPPPPAAPLGITPGQRKTKVIQWP